MKSSPLGETGAHVWRLIGRALGLACAVCLLPNMAWGRPVLSADLASQDGLVRMAGTSGASSVHRRLDVAQIDLAQAAGRLRYGMTVQYGTVLVTDPNDYIGHEADRRSLRIDREVYVGATTSVGGGKSWRLLASAGRVQLRLHDSPGDMVRIGSLNEANVMGWRVLAGLEHRLGAGMVTLGWQMTRYASQSRSDPSQPTHGSAGRVALGITSPL